jgi:hypothetical protein
MLKRLSFLLLALLAQAPLLAQSLLDYSWEENRKLHTLTAAEKEEPALELLHRQSFEYFLDEQQGNMKLYSLTHRIVKVQTDNAIEQYNRIYLPLHNTQAVLRLKARSLSPDGRITEVDKDNMKEIKDEEAGSSGYRIFALEGVVKGSEIEYYMLEESSVGFFGRAYFQSAIPCRKAVFTLKSPAFLQFQVKSYNGLPEAEERLTGLARNLVIEAQDIPALQQQEFAKYNANRRRIEYRLHQNLRSGNSPLLTWADASQIIQEQIYTLSARESKSAEKLFKSLKIPATLSQKEKIQRIENHLKTNFMVQKGVGSSQIDEIIKLGYGTDQGIVRLYAALFTLAGVEHQPGLTSDRSNVRFDPDFASWNYLETYLFYFPKLGQFLAPEDPIFRFPLIPFDHTHNQGLFLQRITIGGIQKVLPKMMLIQTPGHEANFHNMDIRISLPPTLDKVELEVNQSYGGYNAAYLQPAYAFMQKEQREEMIQSLIKFSAPDAQVETYSITGGELNMNLLEKPFVIDARLSSTALLEKAGSKYLLKLGQVIGPQTELYQASERSLSIENEFNRTYDRSIRIQLPEGYTVKNAEDIRIEKVFQRSPDTLPHCIFRSTYSQEGNQLLVKIEEYYREIECSLEEYEQFRDVVNAAADFNKVTLVLEKKAGM